MSIAVTGSSGIAVSVHSQYTLMPSDIEDDEEESYVKEWLLDATECFVHHKPMKRYLLIQVM